MRKIYLTLAIVFLPIFVLAQNTKEYFYYYKGEKQPLELNTEYLYIASNNPKLTNKSIKEVTNKMVLKEDRYLSKIKSRNRKSNTIYAGELKLNRKYSREEYHKLLASLRADKDIEVVSPYFKTKDTDKIGMSRFFYIKLKSLSDTTMLYKFAKEQKTVVLKQDTFMPLWFLLTCTNETEGNTLKIANYFYESGLFESASPDFLTKIQYSCANDTYFSNQWGLKNTGQYGGTMGIDINACEAWAISKGADVTVAVVDDGVELYHPDLQENMHPFSYDTSTASSPSTIQGSHGTACAGIVGAADNNIGMTGVAPNCKIISINGDGTFFEVNAMKLGEGINIAVENGADIISCSWFSNKQPLLEDAITNVLNNGRGGKGCVVVFASGNDNGAVSYPANSNPNILVVGAISNNGSRASFSNYGAELDLVAPGVDIYTTDLQGNVGYNPPNEGTDIADKNYTAYFGGTSAACPHVSGVAALILSVNPELTGKQVCNIIELTAQKIGGYNYSTHANRPNGTWNEEVGYGLVDAYAAVQLASALSNISEITGSNIICDQDTYTIENLPANISVQWSTDNTNLTLVYGQGTGTAVFHKNGNGECTIKANIANGAMSLEKEVWIGEPNLTVKSDDNSTLPQSGTIALCLRASYHSNDKFYFDIDGPYLNEWDYEKVLNEDVFDIYHSYMSATIKPRSLGNGIAIAKVRNACGWGIAYLYIIVEDCDNPQGPGNFFKSSLLTPNNDGINDELKLSNLSSERLVMENHIVIYNSQGAIVYEAYGNDSFRGIGNVGSYASIALPEGVYLYKISGVKETSGYIYIKRK